MSDEPEIIPPDKPLPETHDHPTVTMDIFAAMQDLMQREGPGMLQYGGESEYEYFRGWGHKWREQQKKKEEGPF